MSPSRHAALHHLVRYVAIGAFTVGVDVGIFREALIVAPRWLAVCAGLFVGNLVQFSLNRINFRAFDRAVHRQAIAYVAVTAATWVLSVLGVEIFVRAAHLAPVAAKLATIPLTLPISYLATRYWVFAPAR